MAEPHQQAHGVRLWGSVPVRVALLLSATLGRSGGSTLGRSSGSPAPGRSGSGAPPGRGAGGGRSAFGAERGALGTRSGGRGGFLGSRRRLDHGFDHDGRRRGGGDGGVLEVLRRPHVVR